MKILAALYQISNGFHNCFGKLPDAEPGSLEPANINRRLKKRSIERAKNLDGTKKNLYYNSQAADVAELADAQASGACPRKGVEVQLLSSAFSAYQF